jgi:sterol desaturase/sphingolipid hydroxylase (fatty acid hydroxylase superfamily)
MHALLDKIVARLMQPFSSWEAFVQAGSDIVTTVTSLHSRTGWPYLLSSLVIAYVAYRVGKRRGHYAPEKSFRQVVFPADVYLHRSALVDYKFVLFDRLIRMFVYVPLFSGITYGLYIGLHRVLGESSIQVSSTVALWVLPVYALFVMDLAFFVGHWLMHRVPVLWPFHEVHHSAEVMTPVTLFRTHPVEELVLVGFHSVFIAISGAVFTSVTSVQIHPLSLFGVNALVFFCYFFGFQLRHSHVWVSFGPILSRIFISPAQHQVHHSEAEKHWNKNFGFIFAFWDWMLGTLYVPREREHIVFGCGADPEEYSTMPKLYITPFVKSYRVIERGFRSRFGTSVEPSFGPSAQVLESTRRSIDPRDSGV